MAARPLARDLPVRSRQTTLEGLLALVQEKRRGPQRAPEKIAWRQLDRRARLEALLDRVRTRRR